MGTSMYSPGKKYSEFISDEQMYYLAEHWKEDLAYFKDELSFLQHLMEGVFAAILVREGADQTNKLIAELGQLHLQREALSARTHTLMHDFSLLEQDVLDQDAKGYRNEFGTLEADLASFWKRFREVKSQIFDLASETMKSEKLAKLAE